MDGRPCHDSEHVVPPLSGRSHGRSSNLPCKPPNNGEEIDMWGMARNGSY
jgi:hypothetical protein